MFSENAAPLQASGRRTQQERTAETRRRLIAGAIASLLELGYGSTTVHEICRRAEVTSGALAHHFGSKRQLLAQVVVALFSPFVQEMTVLGPDKASLDARIDRLIERYRAIYFDETYLAVLEILLATKHDPELMRMVAGFREEQLTLLGDFLPHEFPDVALSAERMVDIVHQVLDLLRGFAIHGLYASDPRLRQEILETARDILRRHFADGVPR